MIAFPQGKYQRHTISNMLQMANNYDPIAAIYDPLNHLIFGKATEKAQRWLLQYVPPGASILIVGGGTGRILEALTQLHPTGLRIYYVECAERMMKRAKQKNIGGNEIYYHLQPIETFSDRQQYDVIMTPFLLDNFKDDGLVVICDKLNALLKSAGLWLAADFIIEKSSPGWQRLLLWFMYRFFALTCHVAAQRLPDWTGYFAQRHFIIKAQKKFYRNFIQANVFVKTKIQ